MTSFAPRLPFRAPDPYLHGTDSVLQRLMSVLTTPLGRIPWRPDFGCDLGRFVGLPASQTTLTDLDWHIRSALARWVPDVQILKSEVELVQLHPMEMTIEDEDSYLGSPVEVYPFSGDARMEGHLLGLGTQVGVRVRLQIQTPDGVITVEADPEL